MVLGPGGPCTAMRRRKGCRGEASVCNDTMSHAWYAGPTCKACYDREKAAQSQQKKRVHNEGAEDESGGDNVLEVIKISGSRCASARTPRPSFTSLSLRRRARAQILCHPIDVEGESTAPDGHSSVCSVRRASVSGMTTQA